MIDNIDHYRDRVIACWLGKAVGGTLGLPVEGHDGPLNLSFYNPVPTRMMPNDDLDLQVLWACKLEELGSRIRVDREHMADAWLNHVSFPWDEYGVAIRNLKAGVRPPLSGGTDNWFTNGMGAAIRSEIWACLAPGDPTLAAAYAYEDACVDHAGDGIWAEVFLAALEAKAFVESDPAKLIAVALTHIPNDSILSRAINDTVATWNRTRDWLTTRDHILANYGHENFTDVTMNLAFTVLGWLAGEGDFSRAICATVNCGKDTDCTAATVGSLMGIINPQGIPEEWLRPIGRSLVVDHRITGISPPDTIDGFADLVCRLRERLAGQLPPPADERATDHSAGFLTEVWPLPDGWTLEEVPRQRSAKHWHTPGYWVRPPASFWQAKQMAVRYRFSLTKANSSRIIFNTHSPIRVWCDNRLIIESKGQPMAPSFHRPLKDQRYDVDLTEGMHELIAAIDAPRFGESGEWVWGIGDATTHQWLNIIDAQSVVS